MTVIGNTITPAVDLFYEEYGDGEPVVLVHGGWSDHSNWALAAPALAESFGVVAYDRRGHGSSEPLPEGTTRRDQEHDLAHLVEALGRGPAHLVGTSFGGSIALGAAIRRPDLVRSVVVHEPPLISLVADDPEIQTLIAPVMTTVTTVLERLERDEVEGAARQFVEEIALGPGAWEQLPANLRDVMVAGADAFAVEQQDPEAFAIDSDALSAASFPALVTRGDESPAWFGPIVAELARVLPHAEPATFAGAGHAPHLTHPAEYVAAVTAFLARSRD